MEGLKLKFQKNLSASTSNTMQSDSLNVGEKPPILDIKIDHPILIGGTLRMTQTKQIKNILYG